MENNTGQQDIAAIFDAPTSVQALPSMGGHSQKEFGGSVFVNTKMNVYDSRVMMARIGKILGGPLMQFFGAEEGATGDEEVDVFAKALASLDPEKSIMIIKDLCELTINQSRGRKTIYIEDFNAHETTDIEVALWVAEEQFGNFFSALGGSTLSADMMQIISGQT